MKRILRVAALAAALSGAGLYIAGCDDTNSNTSQHVEEQQTESNQKRLATSSPPPQFDTSLERENLIARLKALNVQNKVGYVYLLGQQGQVVAFYPVKGKVSSLNSCLTTPQQVIWRRPDGVTGQNWQGFVVDSPDFDGSYGKNPEGIFFFTTSGVYVEWSGPYLYADQPLKINTPVTLTSSVDLEKRGN